MNFYGFVYTLLYVLFMICFILFYFVMYVNYILYLYNMLESITEFDFLHKKYNKVSSYTRKIIQHTTRSGPFTCSSVKNFFW